MVKQTSPLRSSSAVPFSSWRFGLHYHFRQGGPHLLLASLVQRSYDDNPGVNRKDKLSYTYLSAIVTHSYTFVRESTSHCITNRVDYCLMHVSCAQPFVLRTLVIEDSRKNQSRSRALLWGFIAFELVLTGTVTAMPLRHDVAIRRSLSF